MFQNTTTTNISLAVKLEHITLQLTYLLHLQDPVMVHSNQGRCIHRTFPNRVSVGG